MSFESKRAYEVWLELIGDEELCAATLRGEHREVVKQRGLDEETARILDEFAALPGTRWNIENLRFRSASEVAVVIELHLPRTARLLTQGIADWLQDISYEYLAHHRWKALGQNRLAEAERFASYVRERIVKRRRPPEHLDAALDLELGIIALERRTALVAAWPDPPQLPESDRPLAEISVDRGPAVSVIELQVDISAWIRGDPLKEPAAPGPISMMVHIPSLRDGPRFTKLSDGARALLEACSGARIGEICERMESEHSLEAEDVLPIIRRWLELRVLRVSA